MHAHNSSRWTIIKRLILLICIANACFVTVSSANDEIKSLNNKPHIYILKKITGDILLNGVMISKGFKSQIQGFSENLTKPDSCIVVAGQYYPSTNNAFGTDGNFFTKIHLQALYTEMDLVPQCKPKVTVKKGAAYYFLALTGEDQFQMLYKHTLLSCHDSITFPKFKQPIIEEWFKVPCIGKNAEKTNKKIWIKLDQDLIKNKNICKLTAPAPEYSLGLEHPTIKGDCKL